MKAIRKSDGMVIDVDVYDEQVSWVCQVKTTYVDIDQTELYQESDLDFLPEKEIEEKNTIIMNKTKDQQAQEYAEKKDRALLKAWHIYRYGEIKEGDDWENDPIKPFGNFEEGFKAGVSFFEQSQWRSVEEELPEPDTMCLVFGYQDLDFNNGINLYTMMAWYDGEDFYDAYNDRKYHPVKWMAIPLPDINTEKK